MAKKSYYFVLAWQHVSIEGAECDWYMPTFWWTLSVDKIEYSKISRLWEGSTLHKMSRPTCIINQSHNYCLGLCLELCVFLPTSANYISCLWFENSGKFKIQEPKFKYWTKKRQKYLK